MPGYTGHIFALEKVTQHVKDLVFVPGAGIAPILRVSGTLVLLGGPHRERPYIQPVLFPGKATGLRAFKRGSRIRRLLSFNMKVGILPLRCPA